MDSIRVGANPEVDGRADEKGAEERSAGDEGV